MKVFVDDVAYDVRHNYLHRGINPRIVLGLKENGRYVFVQMEKTIDKPEFNKPYKGYWCGKETRQITIVFK